MKENLRSKAFRFANEHRERSKELFPGEIWMDIEFLLSEHGLTDQMDHLIRLAKYHSTPALKERQEQLVRSTKFAFGELLMQLDDVYRKNYELEMECERHKAIIHQMWIETGLDPNDVEARLRVNEQVVQTLHQNEKFMYQSDIIINQLKNKKR